LKTSYGERGWLKTSHGVKKSKIAQKNHHMIFKCSLRAVSKYCHYPAVHKLYNGRALNQFDSHLILWGDVKVDFVLIRNLDRLHTDVIPLFFGIAVAVRKARKLQNLSIQ